MNKKMTLDTLVAWAKRRGFVFASSEIYGGFSAVYDYGHYGTLLKNTIQRLWWKEMVLNRDDVVGLDSGIFMHPKTWHASGHVESFDDPLIECKNCHYRMRADHLLEKFDLDVDRWPIDEVNKEVDRLKSEGKLKCEKCGSDNLTEAKQFNLLIRTNFGSPTDQISDENVVYPRGETCQGIYLNFKNTIDSMRVKLPLGIAQVGKAFRNEIVARQFIFRTREFEQMEMQYFLHPDDMDKKFEYWMNERWNWYVNVLKLPEEKLKWKEHEKLAHYAKAAYDIQYKFASMGDKFDEVEGVHQRGDWDLSRHQEFSGKNLQYFDQVKGEKYIPHIMETSVGLTRLFLVVIDNAYTEEDLGDGKSRVVMKFPAHIAPVKVAVFPLQKDNKLQEKAKSIYEMLKTGLDDVVEFDDVGNIGKMYRRQDEIGTPFCVTVDYDSLNDEMVTVRDRDSMNQERVKISELNSYLKERIWG